VIASSDRFFLSEKFLTNEGYILIVLFYIEVEGLNASKMLAFVVKSMIYEHICKSLNKIIFLFSPTSLQPSREQYNWFTGVSELPTSVPFTLGPCPSLVVLTSWYFIYGTIGKLLPQVTSKILP